MTMRLLTTAAIAFCMSAKAMANDYKVGSIEISTPWSRATPKGAQTAIGYMTIKNNGTTPDRLIGGSVDVADRFQLHAMTMENGIAKMRELSDIEIKPGQTIECLAAHVLCPHQNLMRVFAVKECSWWLASSACHFRNPGTCFRRAG